MRSRPPHRAGGREPQNLGSRAKECALYSDPHLHPLPNGERGQTELHGALALDEDAALGADAHTVHVGASVLGRADRLVDGRAFVEIRLERLAFVEREIYLDGICWRRLRALRRASAEREHRGQSGGRKDSQSGCANFRDVYCSGPHRVLLYTTVAAAVRLFRSPGNPRGRRSRADGFYTRWARCLKEGIAEGNGAAALWDGEPDDCQRRHLDCDRMRKSVPRNCRGFDPAHVAGVGAAVRGRVGVENLAIEAGAGYADAKAAAQHGREIADADEAAIGARRRAHERDHVAVGVVGFEPSKARGIGVGFPQRGLVAVDAIEIAHEDLQLAMVWIFEQVPVEARVVIPFTPLADFLAHENQLLARARPHVRE